MGPIHPRLRQLLRAPTASGWLAALAVFTVANTAALIVQALAIADVVVAVVDHAAFTQQLMLLAALLIGRAAITAATEYVSARLAAVVKAELRTRLIDDGLAHGPQWLAGNRVGSHATLITTGVENLDAYFARYIPALLAAAITPIAVIAALGWWDWSVAIIVSCTVPLLPLFAILIGWATQRHLDRQWHALSQLAGHFLDVVAGLPTLLVHGRAKAQVTTIRSVAEQHRKATGKASALAFLSGGVLELVATISVALVAVSVGLRLVHGGVGLATAVAVLVLTPEAYWPIRRVGAEYHAAAAGVAIAKQLPEPRAVIPAQPMTLTPGATVHIDNVTVPGRLPPASFEIAPRSLTVLWGPSGAGKTTLIQALLGFQHFDGVIRHGDFPVRGTEPAWRNRLAWLPQHPEVDGEPIDVVRTGAPEVTVDAAARALIAVGLDPTQPAISAGQQRRLALARVLVRAERLDDGLVLLDEPTAFVDDATQQHLCAVIARLATCHRVVAVTHHPMLRNVADQVISVGDLVAA